MAARPVAVPGPEAWPDLTPEAIAYLRVRSRGVYRHEASTLVQAVTTLGGGFWVLTPFVDEGGFTVLVNRGFVPAGRRDPTTWIRPEGPVALTGLLRVSEPGGAFLRSNDAAADRWYARDVAAIARARGLDGAAPFFIDAEATGENGVENEGLPVAGLTVVRFSDNHLVYALTWFTLAAMLLAATLFLDRQARRERGSGPAG